MTHVFFLVASQDTPGGIPDIVTAFEAGEIGVAIGLVLGLIVAVFRQLQVSTMLDGTAGMVVAALVAGVSTSAGMLGAGNDILASLVSGLVTALTTFSARLVPARG